MTRLITAITIAMFLSINIEDADAGHDQFQGASKARLNHAARTAANNPALSLVAQYGGRSCGGGGHHYRGGYRNSYYGGNSIYRGYNNVGYNRSFYGGNGGYGNAYGANYFNVARPVNGRNCGYRGGNGGYGYGSGIGLSIGW